MSYQSKPVPVPAGTVFIDTVIESMRAKLSSELPWLEKAYGRSYRRAETRTGNSLVLPAVFETKSTDLAGEYIPMEFNDGLMAYCFFEIGDKTAIDFVEQASNYYSIPVNIVFWANLVKINDTFSLDLLKRLPSDYYFAELLQGDVRGVLTKKMTKIGNARLSISETVDNADDVFSEYDFDREARKFLEFPWAGFRINTTIEIQEPCYTESFISSPVVPIH